MWPEKFVKYHLHSNGSFIASWSHIVSKIYAFRKMRAEIFQTQFKQTADYFAEFACFPFFLFCWYRFYQLQTTTFTAWNCFTYRSHVYFCLPMIYRCHYFYYRAASQTKVNWGSDHLPSSLGTAHSLPMAENRGTERIFTFRKCRYIWYLTWWFCLNSTGTRETKISEIVQSTSSRFQRE